MCVYCAVRTGSLITIHVNIIPPAFRAQLQRRFALSTTTNDGKPGKLRNSNALSETEACGVEKYCHLVCEGLNEAETSDDQSISYSGKRVGRRI